MLIFVRSFFISFCYVKERETKNWAHIKDDIKMDIRRFQLEVAEQTGSFNPLNTELNPICQ